MAQKAFSLRMADVEQVRQRIVRRNGIDEVALEALSD
jgi:hypothetical protein